MYVHIKTSQPCVLVKHFISNSLAFIESRPSLTAFSLLGSLSTQCWNGTVGIFYHSNTKALLLGDRLSSLRCSVELMLGIAVCQFKKSFVFMDLTFPRGALEQKIKSPPRRLP